MAQAEQITGELSERYVERVVIPRWEEFKKDPSRGYTIEQAKAELARRREARSRLSLWHDRLSP